jgi:hypothetical protein
MHPGDTDFIEGQEKIVTQMRDEAGSSTDVD